METSNLVVTLRQWTGVLLLGALLIMGPIAAVGSAGPVTNVKRLAVEPIDPGALFRPGPMLVETIRTAARVNGIVSSARAEEFEFYNVTATSRNIVHTESFFLNEEEIVIDPGVSGSSTMILTDDGVTGTIALADENGQEWTFSVSSVDEVAEGYLIQGTLSSVNESASFQAILGFDGFVTVLDPDPVLDELAAPLAAYIDVTGRMEPATALVIVLVVFFIVAVVCIYGIFSGRFSCEAKPALDEFPILDRQRPILRILQSAVV